MNARQDPTDMAAGFTVAELVVALCLALLVVASMIALANPATLAARAQPEAIDLAQRLRAVSRFLEVDLRGAGAGMLTGPAPGSLAQFVPALWPRRIGANADPPDVARADAISALWVPQDALEAALDSVADPSSITLPSGPGCASSRPACGLRTGDGVLVFDPLGSLGLFSMASATATVVHLRTRGTAAGVPLATPALVAAVAVVGYYYDAASRQLHKTDADLSDVVVLDEVTRFTVDYFGVADRPSAVLPPVGLATCAYDASGAARPFEVLGIDTPGDLAAMPLAMLRDGPWCGTGDTRFDADLLRVRRIRISIAGQAPSAAVRGAGSAFAMPGLSRSAWSWVPDLAGVIEIAPPNLEVD